MHVRSRRLESVPKQIRYLPSSDYVLCAATLNNKKIAFLTHGARVCDKPSEQLDIWEGVSEFHLRSMEWFNDCKRLAVGDANGVVAVWDAEKHRRIWATEGQGPGSDVRGLSMRSNDENLMVTGDSMGILSLYDVRIKPTEGPAWCSLYFANRMDEDAESGCSEYNHGILSVLFDEYHEHNLMVTTDDFLAIFDDRKTRREGLVAESDPLPSCPTELSSSRNGEFLIHGDDDGFINLWRTGRSEHDQLGFWQKPWSRCDVHSEDKVNSHQMLSTDISRDGGSAGISDVIVFDDDSILVALEDGQIRLFHNLPPAMAGQLTPHANARADINIDCSIAMSYNMEVVASIGMNDYIQIQDIDAEAIAAATQVRKSHMGRQGKKILVTDEIREQARKASTRDFFADI